MDEPERTCAFRDVDVGAACAATAGAVEGSALVVIHNEDDADAAGADVGLAGPRGSIDNLPDGRTLPKLNVDPPSPSPSRPPSGMLRFTCDARTKTPCCGLH